MGRMIRWARKRAGMTQHDLANALEMPQPSIARIERGTVIPRTTTLMAILEATGHQMTVEPAGAPVDRGPIRQRLRLDVPRRTWLALGRAAKNRRTSPTQILRRLRGAGVPFVLIGELAEVAHGSPATIRKAVEICHAGSDVARHRLHAALAELVATSVDATHYKTRAGHLRVVTETAAGDDYDTLVRTAVPVLIDTAIQVHVASIDDLIRIRRAGGMTEDRTAEAILRAIGEEVATEGR